MVHTIFDGSNLKLDKFYPQTGSGAIAYFEGLPPFQRGYGNFYRQHGAGVGSVLRSLWRYLKPLAATIKPIAINVGKELGKEGLSTTARVLGKIAEGGDVKETVMAEGGEGMRKLLRKAGIQTGSGKKRKRKFRPKSGVILKPSDIVGKTVPQKVLLKKKRIDTLGYY